MLIWGISILAGLESSRGMWQTVSDVSFSNPDLTSRQCALTRFPIFGILRWIFCHHLPVGVVLSRFSLLASTGKQSDPTRGLSRFRDVEKRGGWKELDMDQLARTATPRASFRILTESGIMLWRHRLLNTIASKTIDESCACNLRSETWRRWLSACLRTHLMCARALAVVGKSKHLLQRHFERP